jgi:hypothetical protein
VRWVDSGRVTLVPLHEVGKMVFHRAAKELNGRSFVKDSRWCALIVALLVVCAADSATFDAGVRTATAENGRTSAPTNGGATAAAPGGSIGSTDPVEKIRSWRFGDETVYRQARQDSTTARPMQPAGGTSQVCIARFEAAAEVEVVTRADRRVTGVWRVMESPSGSCRKPDYVISDVNGCLYGSTGDVWGPLDCPGSGFSIEGHLPMSFKMEGKVDARSASGTTWRWVDPTPTRAPAAAEESPPRSSFVLAYRGGRGAIPTPATEEKVICWWVSWWQLYCETWEPAPIPGIAAYDVSGGTIAIRLADDSSLCLNPSGSSGLCRGPLPEGRIHNEPAAKIQEKRRD